MSKHEQEQLFAKWLETELSEEEQAQFEDWCKHDRAFAEKVATVGKVESMSHAYEPLPTPRWSPADLYKTKERSSWWQWSGLPAMSFATSMIAILMVTLKVEVVSSEAGLTISFAGASQQRQIQQIVRQEIDVFEQSQADYLASKTEQLQKQQLDMNTQLANYLLTTSRTERREDFAEFIKHVNQQRTDDQVFYARQLNNLKEDFVANSDSPVWSSGVQALPATDRE